MSEEATIYIYRQPDFLNRMREFIVFVDGEKVAYVRNEQAKEIKVAPGNHTVFVKAGMSKIVTLNLSLALGEVRNFECGPSKQTLQLFWILFILIPLANTGLLNRISPNRVGIWILALIMVGLFVALIMRIFL